MLNKTKHKTRLTYKQNTQVMKKKKKKREKEKVTKSI